ncbi:protein IQ-DOMAIN 20-like isoform X2 [Cryptomeria japonica]|uniref:protein IQ-DOMAIN 20-like isoform X2 n=1 Tax=Cryptomeria japonica TaxID=3369 RepID=UPI0025AD4AAE|nr:protein IQ-DOMAIN 20-like isoform X2 [Cryptomeria japonica]
MAKESSVKDFIISSIKSPSSIHTTPAWTGSPQIAKTSALQRSTSEIDLGWSREEHAAIKIQAAYRGYLAVFRGYLVRRQVHLALHRMETLMSLQARLRSKQLFINNNQ